MPKEYDWDAEGNEIVDELSKIIIPSFLQKVESALAQAFRFAPYFISYNDFTRFIMQALEEKVRLSPEQKEKLYSEFKKIYEKTQKEAVKEAPLKLQFNMADERSINYALSLSDFYLGKFFQGDKKLRLDVVKWLSKYYLEQGNPIGKGQEGIKHFLNEFGSYLKQRTESKARQVIDTSVNHLRNSARLRAMAKARITKYRWDAVGDRLTCPYCRAMDGRIFETGDAIRTLELIESDPASLPEVKPFLTSFPLDKLKSLPSSQMPSRMPPAHPHCRCRLVSYIEEIEELYPVVVEQEVQPKSLEETAILQELTTELKALRPEELTARIKAHLASDWRRNPDGTLDIKANRLKAEFERHAKDLNVQSLKEYERLSYEVIRNPEHVFIQRAFNPQTKKFETNYIFVRNGVYVISNDEALAIQTCGRLKKDIESWLSELSENSQSATVKLLGGRTTPAQPRKLEDQIDKYDFRSIQDVERMLKDFSEKRQDLLLHRVKDSKVKKNVDYIMAVDSKDGKNATFIINKYFEKALISALQNFKNKVPLTKEDEMILQSLWHELTHLRTKDIFKFYSRLSQTERDLLETVNDFIARHTYDEFLKMLRPTAKPQYQKEVIEKGLGYLTFVRRFRYVLQKFKINEKEAVKELESILFEDGKNIYGRLVNWLKTKADLLAFESDDIIKNIVNRKMIDEKFQKEVEEYYERRKKRRLSS
jgi:SPP1 gp7 family putative phage head morphogenesis protein